MRSTRRAFASFVAGIVVLGAGVGAAAERSELRDWPSGASPREIGKRVA
jgi:hypothetical protein